MNEMPSLKEIVKDNKVYFSHYRAGKLHYKVDVNEETYIFPVPTDDGDEATFEATDKAIIFMRYIRKAIENNKFELTK